jgi:hypothetical protein
MPRAPAVLWQLRERYRALLSDLSDGAIDLAAARRGRDALMLELHAIYVEAPPEDYKIYQAAAQALLSAGDGELGEEEIDAFLAKSLQASFPDPQILTVDGGAGGALVCRPTPE